MKVKRSVQASFALRIRRLLEIGLYDVLAALRWVKSYISFTRSDPNSITATGQSAGAVLIKLHDGKSAAKGPDPLFHRAIILSGSALNPWAVTRVQSKINS